MKRLLLVVLILLLLLSTIVSVASAKPSNPDHPYVIGVGSHLNAIFNKGAKLGNLPNVAMKVGDSNSWLNYHWKTLAVGKPIVWGDYEYLSEVRDYFAATGTFQRNSAATRNAGTTELILNEVTASTSPRTRLLHEFYVMNGAFAYITLGTVDSDVTQPYHVPLAEYRANMRVIIEMCIERGIIPVLFTIPQRTTLDRSMWLDTDSYNQVIRALADEYRIPLADARLWYDTLPDVGLGSDLLHLSIGNPADFSAQPLSGHAVFNLLSLQVMYELQKVLNNGHGV